MSPSSLIFVVVIAIWATYLVVYVARRREYLATARTVDRFSRQMRVLQRRAVRAEAAERTRASRSSGVISADPPRARPLAATVSGETFLLGHLRSGDGPGPSTLVRAAARPDTAASGGVAVQDPDGGVERGHEPIPFNESGFDPGARSDQWRSPYGRQTPTQRTMRRRRRVRAAALLLAVLAALVTGVLAAIGVLPWGAPLAGGVATTLILAWLRAAAVTERAARHRRRGAARRESERAERLEQERIPTARPGTPALRVAREHVVHASRPDPVEVAEAAAQAIQPVERVSPSAPSKALPVVPVDPLMAENGWTPTPVPPPTYSLKDRAQHPLPEPLVVPVPVPIDVEDDDVAWTEGRVQARVVNA